MDIFPGYAVEDLIFNNAGTMVFRVEKNDTGKQFILKTTASDHPSFNQKAKYRHEYEILKILKSSGVKYIVRVSEMGISGHRPFLIMEDLRCSDLESIRKSEDKNPFDVETVLEIGIKICCGLKELYKAGIVHKDIKPGNILYNRDTKILKLVDFSSASAVFSENSNTADSVINAATLAYMSPEQTGRMNRRVDWRTDFYSFGVTLYELLTGALPFQYDDPLDMVHAHMAMMPESPRKINKNIPENLSAVIMKLMSKNADKRYKSAFGIKYDLEQCRAFFMESAASKDFLSYPFETGQKDIADIPIIPQKLYGREKEIEILIKGFKKTCRGESRMLLVKGEPGIGKSALVNEVKRSMVQERGYFISGKFDKLKQKPYGALIHAFKELIHHILSQDDNRIFTLKKKLINILGANGQVMIDVIPDVELIIGKQNPISETGPVENENRFISVFENFMGAFISRNHPLVLFLDDLQWADPASLNMIKRFLALKTGYLYVIGAFRDNEIHDGCPLMITVEEIKNNGIKVETIGLSQLTKEHINLLISETLLCSREDSKPLSGLCLEKTGGNPFFLNQFILSLFDEKLIRLNEKYGKWEWDYAKIKFADLTDNAADLMIKKISSMSVNAQKILKYAACTGNIFDLNTLSIVYGKSIKDTSVDLFEVLLKGFILPLDESYKYISGLPSDLTNNSFAGKVKYKFLHDRVHQAAYSLIKDEEKQKIHLKAGNELIRSSGISKDYFMSCCEKEKGRTGLAPWILSENKKDNNFEKHVFDITDHLNAAEGLIAEKNQKQLLAQLNLSAGKKAKKSAAFEQAWDYFKAGIKMLEKDSWSVQYSLSLHLHEQAAETAFLLGNFMDMEDEIKNVIEKAETILDMVQVYKTKIQACTSRHELLQAVETGFLILKKLGVNFPEKPGRLQVYIEYFKTKFILAGKSDENLINMPKMTDPYAYAALDIMQTMGFSVYVATPEKAPFFIFKGIYLSVRFGNTAFSSIFYVHYAIFLCGMAQNLEYGYKLGITSLKLLEKFHAMEFAPKTEVVFNFFVRHWKEPLKSTLMPLKNTYKKGFETGDFEFAAAAASQYPYFCYFAGVELSQVAKKALKYNKIIKRLKQKSWQSYNERTWQTALNLMGCGGNPALLSGDVFDEKKMLYHYKKENDRTGICSLYINKMILSYLFHDYNTAAENARSAEKHLIALTSHASIPVFYFYESLTFAALFYKKSNSKRKRIIKKLARNQKKMKKWAVGAPSNYFHKWCLVEALLMQFSGKDNKAAVLYNKAIEGAGKNQYVQEEALANELASVFYLEKKDANRAEHHMAEAKYCYEIWGAMAKVHDLDKKYPFLLSKDALPRERKGRLYSDTVSEVTADTGFNMNLPQVSITTSTTFMDRGQLDLNAVLKASQIISGEIRIEKLIASLMEIIVANAGAEKGFLILKYNEKMRIEAEYTARDENLIVMESTALENFPDIAKNVINFTIRTKKSVVLGDAENRGEFTEDPHIIKNRVKSILCAPLLYQGKLNGVIYLENNMTSNAFTEERLEILFLLCNQASISLENARLYKTLQNYTSTLEEKVEERTSELEKSIETIKHTQKQLIQSEKLAALGNLVAGVAHEINTPVGVSMTSASFLKDKTDDFIDKLESKTLTRSHVNRYTKIAGKSSDLIMNNLTRAVKIIHGFKQVAVDQTSGERREFNLKSYINDIIASLEPEIKKLNPEIIINCPENLSLASFPGAFSQIVTNLVMNSLIHGFDPEDTGCKIIFDIKHSNDTIIFVYRDNGKGIEKENIKKIFEPFFTTKRAGGGSGLGMHIVHNLVTGTLGGSISCRSENGNGVVFKIILPFKTGST